MNSHPRVEIDHSSTFSDNSVVIPNSDSIPNSQSSTNPTSRSPSATSYILSKRPTSPATRKTKQSTGVTESRDAQYSTTRESTRPDMNEPQSHTAPSSPVPAEAEMERSVTATKTYNDSEEETGTHTEIREDISSSAEARSSDDADYVDAPEPSDAGENLLHGNADPFNVNWKLASPAKKPTPKKNLRARTSDADAHPRRKSTRFERTVEKVAETTSALGKRGRGAVEEVVETSKDVLGAIRRKKSQGKRLTEGEKLILEQETNRIKLQEKKEKTTLHLDGMSLEDLEKLERLPRGWSYNIPEEELRAAKKRKLAEKGQTTHDDKMVDSEIESEEEEEPEPALLKQPRKKYLAQGLYVGQKRGYDPRLKPDVNLKRLSRQTARENSVLPMPMFTGEAMIEKGRNFKLPYDVFSPLPAGGPKPEQWKKISKNRFIGDAQQSWAKINMQPSACVCRREDGCGEDCLNRFMNYECNDDLCAIGPRYCTNRSFADLRERYDRHRLYDVGIEVAKYPNKGFGVRACRCFDEDQIILEYAGEIITEEECQRRMNEDYKDSENFYLMEFEQGMLIDATSGSAARFVNHSCNPNCEMRKYVVDNRPRMALFARTAITTGDELTYDYNFQPNRDPQPCHCGEENCRGVIGPRPAKDKEMARARERAEQAKNKAVKAARTAKTVKAAPKPVSKEVQKAVEKSATRTIAKPVSKKVEKPVQKTVPKTVEKPAVKPPPKPRSLVSGVFAGMGAGMKRKFEQTVEAIRGSSKSDASKIDDDRSARLKKRRKTATPAGSDETDIPRFPGLRDRQTRISSSESGQRLLEPEASPDVVQSIEKRDISGASTLVPTNNNSHSTIKLVEPEPLAAAVPAATELTALEKEMEASKTEEPQPARPSVERTTSKFTEHLESTPDVAGGVDILERVASLASVSHSAAPAASAAVPSPRPVSASAHKAAPTLEPLRSGSPDSSPEHRAMRNPWLDSKSSRKHARESQPASLRSVFRPLAVAPPQPRATTFKEFFENRTRQGTLEGFFSRKPDGRTFKGHKTFESETKTKAAVMRQQLE